MAKIWNRDGLKVTFLPGGKVGIEVDVAALAAAREFEVVGSVRVYEIDTNKLRQNVTAEAGRLVKRIRKAVKK